MALLCVLLLAAAPLHAQIGPGIYQLPWGEEPHWSETFDDVAIFPKVDTQVGGERARTWIWDSKGRIKVEKESTEPVFTLGYKAFTTDTKADDGFIDGQLNDVAVVGAGRLGEIVDGWSFQILAGIGTANDGHWRNTDALYASLAGGASTELGERSALHLGVLYDGNSGLFPDIPLPYVAWSARVSDRLDVLLGSSETRVAWRPLDRIEVTLRYAFPAGVDLWCEYALFEDRGDWLQRLGLFVGYTRVFNGFHEEGLEHRRSFYEHDRIHAGVRWAGRYFDFGFQVGYVLNHRFRLGWDIRDLETVADLDGSVFAGLRAIGYF